jgi:RimJ/RimL family protein N-acetyltransferase
MKTLESERLILRKFTEDDFADVHSYASCAENVVYMVWGPNSEEQTRVFINMAISKANEIPCVNYQYAAVLKHTNKLIGACNLARIRSDEAEIGWILHHDYWKQGYGTEMGKAILGLAFDILSLRRVFAFCDAENIGSYKVMERIGMRREGLYIEGRPAHKMSDKEYGDELSYAILKNEWEARKKICPRV